MNDATAAQTPSNSSNEKMQTLIDGGICVGRRFAALPQKRRTVVRSSDPRFLVNRVKDHLIKIYGDKIRKVILYGSHVRSYERFRY